MSCDVICEHARHYKRVAECISAAENSVTAWHLRGIKKGGGSPFALKQRSEISPPQEARMSASAAPTSRVPLPTISIEPPKLVITVPWQHKDVKNMNEVILQLENGSNCHINEFDVGSFVDLKS